MADLAAVEFPGFDFGLFLSTGTVAVTVAGARG